MGKNTLAKIPCKVAQFLKLENAHQYTGHCLRRTSATLLVNAGDILTLKQYGGWETSTVAEGYVAECISRKREVTSHILTSQKPSEERPNRNISIASTSCSEPNNLFAKKTQTLNEPEVHSKDRLDMESVIIRSTTNQQDIVNVSSEGSSSTGGISFNNLIKSDEQSFGEPNKLPLYSPLYTQIEHIHFKFMKSPTEQINGIKIFHYCGGINFATRNIFRKSLIQLIGLNPQKEIIYRSKLSERISRIKLALTVLMTVKM
ncbi:hypothetical protein NQ315_000607 [Exocentrus adspersus]|uniref:Tyr recombinase domain-containing protein n=1 Tax=Exocentrus adspersus TaxID=1586481 RepID=A0AAV8VNJ1_9CUCU|nr:hypothetical protein NQ315_000607 [Exocentrus adspersus]